jgi:hypothetical protein
VPFVAALLLQKRNGRIEPEWDGDVCLSFAFRIECLSSIRGLQASIPRLYDVGGGGRGEK